MNGLIQNSQTLGETEMTQEIRFAQEEQARQNMIDRRNANALRSAQERLAAEKQAKLNEALRSFFQNK